MLFLELISSEDWDIIVHVVSIIGIGILAIVVFFTALLCIALALRPKTPEEIKQDELDQLEAMKERQKQSS